MSLRKAARGRLLQGGARQGAATEGHTCLTAAAAGHHAILSMSQAMWKELGADFVRGDVLKPTCES